MEELLTKIRAAWADKMGRNMHGAAYDMVDKLGLLEDYDDQMRGMHMAGVIIGEATSPEDAIARLEKLIAERNAE